MEALPRPARLSLTLASIAVSVFLFACGAGGGSDTSSESPPGTGEAAPADVAGRPPVAAGRLAAESSPGDDGADPEVIERASSAPVVPPAFRVGGTPRQEPAPASQPSSPPGPPRREAGGRRVFTNADLEEYRRAAEASSGGGAGRRRDTVDVSGGGSSGGPSAPTPGDSAPEESSDAAEEIASTREAIARQTEDLDYLRSRIPSLHNPFLPRVQPSERDRTAEEGMDNVQRLEHVGRRIAAGEARLTDLRRKLEGLTRASAPEETAEPERP